MPGDAGIAGDSLLHTVDTPHPLPRAWFLRDARAVARDLIGCCIAKKAHALEHSPGASTPAPHRTNRLLLARIVETEAYLPDDAASHSFRGPTARNRSMFAEGGTAYVYLIYGIHHCLNVATGPAGEGAAVLIRAVEFPSQPDPGRPDAAVLGANGVRGNGPGLLTRALGITREYDDGRYLTLPGSLYISGALSNGSPVRLMQDRRIGITRAKEELWRYLDAASPAVSRRPGPHARPVR